MERSLIVLLNKSGIKGCFIAYLQDFSHVVFTIY